MEIVQVELPPDIYRKLVAEAARQGKPAPLVAQEWVIERAAAAGALPDADAQALAVLRDVGLLTELIPNPGIPCSSRHARPSMVWLRTKAP
jgi:hypothetical protein